MIKLLHKDVYLPKQISIKCQQLNKQWTDMVETNHIREHFENSIKDKSHNYTFEGAIQSLKETQKNTIEPFEVEVNVENDRWEVTKYCIRIKYLNTNQDICFSLRPVRGNWNKVLLVTAWMNSSTDNHRTLDYNRYNRSL